MNLAAIDLNLLVAFEALYEERHVTRAGRRVGRAQSSMSNALTRLRHLLNDKLFIRAGQVMQPTPKAMALAPAISFSLNQLRDALDRTRKFDPLTEKRKFVIGATDYGNIVLIPPLVAALRRQAPGIDLSVKPTTDRNNMLRRLECGELDVLLGGHLPSSPQTLRRRLFAERFVCIHDKLRGRSKRLTVRQYMARPHALYTPTDDEPSARQLLQAEPGNVERISLTSPHIAALPFAIAGTDLVATMSERIARRFASGTELAVSSLPFDVPPFDIDLVQARYRASEAPISWFVDLICAVAREL